MRIKKTSQYIEGGASLSNVYGTSDENGYTQEYINGLQTYSGTEQQIGVYLNKPLYKRIIVVDPLVHSNISSETEIATIPNIYEIIKIDAVLWNSARSLCQQMPYTNATGDVSKIVYSENTNKFTFSSRETWSNAKLVLILEYTKTTD